MEPSYMAQLEKSYKRYLEDLVAGKDFEPILLRGGKGKPSTAIELHQQVALFQKNEKRDKTPGWTIEWQDWFSKKLGNQSWPSQITVSTEEDLLFLTDKSKHAAEFKKILNTLLEWTPAIQPLLQKYPNLVHEHKDDWNTLMAVTSYLLNNQTSGQYLRSIPVPAHTKFMQQKKSILLSLLKTIRPDIYDENHLDLEIALGTRRKPYLFTMRFLDPELSQVCLSGIECFALPVEEIKNKQWPVKRVILVENETNLYLLPSMPGTLAIFSSGKALHLLHEIELFKNASLYYWGDLDEEGLVMLNDARTYYPKMASIFMDTETMNTHIQEMHQQPQPYKSHQLNNLSSAEKTAYDQLYSHNGRIEQERLRQDYIMKKLLSLG